MEQTRRRPGRIGWIRDKGFTSNIIPSELKVEGSQVQVFERREGCRRTPDNTFRVATERAETRSGPFGEPERGTQVSGRRAREFGMELGTKTKASESQEFDVQLVVES